MYTLLKENSSLNFIGTLGGGVGTLRVVHFENTHIGIYKCHGVNIT